MLIILTGLGAGYWGYGLFLVLITLGERANHEDLLFFTNRIIGTGMFVFFEVAIINKRIQRRLLAWSLFLVILVAAVAFTYLFEGVLAYL
ncbi:MAG: hypothetical protein ACYC6B_06505 [Thermoleophilia bacterium]